MGYTHYWKRSRPAARQEWAEYMGDIFSIVKHCTGEGIPLVDGMGDEGSLPVISSGEVAFNGVGEEAHETFMITATPNDRGGGFCKTAHKPYDLAVCLALIMAKKRFGPDIEVTSDGDVGEWQEAFATANLLFKVLGEFCTTFDANQKVSTVTLEVN